MMVVLDDCPPIIDLRDYDARKQEIMTQLMDAAKTTGFFYIRAGDLLPQDVVNRHFEVNKRYFEVPEEVLAKLPVVDWADPNGRLGHGDGNSTSEGVLRIAHWKWWDHHAVADTAFPPEEYCPGFKKTTNEYMSYMPAIYDKILACFALGLGLPEDHFKEITDRYAPDNKSILVVNKYPSTEGINYKPGTERISAHTDEGLITLVVTSPNSAGLQLAAGKDGKALDSRQGLMKVEAWHPCPHKPGCIVVNVGDALQALSDGVLKSTYHRVRLPEPGEPVGERYSFAHFVYPRHGAIIQGPKKAYPAVTFEQFMVKKSEGFAYTLPKDPKKYEFAQENKLTLGMPHVTAAA